MKKYFLETPRNLWDDDAERNLKKVYIQKTTAKSTEESEGINYVWQEPHTS